MKHSVITSGESQRERTRDSLFMGAKVTVGQSPIAVSTVIRNLSAGGVMIDAPTTLKKNDVVISHLRNIGDVRGTVAWVHNGRAGIMFDQPIDPEEVRSSIKKPSEIKPIVNGAVLSPLAKGSFVDVMIPGFGTFRGSVDWVEDKRMGLSFERSLLLR